MPMHPLILHMSVAAIHVADGEYRHAMKRLRLALSVANQIKDEHCRNSILALIGRTSRAIDRKPIRAKATQLRQELAHA